MPIAPARLPAPPAVCAIPKKSSRWKIIVFAGNGCCRAPKMLFGFPFFFLLFRHLSPFSISLSSAPTAWVAPNNGSPHAHNQPRVGVPSVVLLYLATDTEGPVLPRTSLINRCAKREIETETVKRKPQ